MDRISRLLKKIKPGNADYYMMKLLDVLEPAGLVPQVGKSYFFIYIAKSPNITFDRHPLVTVNYVASWGFSGYSHHWNKTRNYDYSEMMSQLYEINDSELGSAIRYPVMKIMGG